jgi:hypothetical protein
MISVTFWSDKELAPVTAEIQEGRDPFEVCALAAARLWIEAPARDEKFERIMAKRASEAQGNRVSEDTGCQILVTPALSGVRDTSMEAYRKHEARGSLTAQQRRIYELFAAHPSRTWTRSEVAEAIKMRINSCVGRVNEMLAEPFPVLEECGRRRCAVTGENVYELRLR